MATDQKRHFIVVFNDGETWSTVAGCKLMCLNNEQYDELMQRGCNPDQLSSKIESVTLTTKLWNVFKESESA